jgi:TetR/AcrR family transcriptional repressor of nem operon
VARSKSFDPDTALGKAMQLFWRQGYEATSIDDLVRAMGINRASLYGTFGDKRALFLRVLDRYISTVQQPRLSALDRAPSATAAIKGMLIELAAFAAGDPQRRGCLLVNSACELGSRDPDVAARLKAQAGALEARLTELLARAQQSGEIPPSHKVSALARTLATIIEGVRVRSKLGVELDYLDSILDATIAIIGPVQKGR